MRGQKVSGHAKKRLLFPRSDRKGERRNRMNLVGNVQRRGFLGKGEESQRVGGGCDGKEKSVERWNRSK